MFASRRDDGGMLMFCIVFVCICVSGGGKGGM